MDDATQHIVTLYTAPDGQELESMSFHSGGIATPSAGERYRFRKTRGKGVNKEVVSYVEGVVRQREVLLSSQRHRRRIFVDLYVTVEEVEGNAKETLERIREEQ